MIKFRSTKNSLNPLPFKLYQITGKSPEDMSRRSKLFLKLLANVYIVPLKRSVQFLFLCKPPKSGALWVYSMFLQIVKKILTTDTIHWLVVIPNFSSYRYSVWEKQPLGFLKISENLQENNKKTVFLVQSMRLGKLIKGNTCRYLHCMYRFFLILFIYLI